MGTSPRQPRPCATTIRRTPRSPTSDTEVGTDTVGGLSAGSDHQNRDLCHRAGVSGNVLLRLVRGRGDGGIRHDEQLLGVRVGRSNGVAEQPGSGAATPRRIHGSRRALDERRLEAEPRRGVRHRHRESRREQLPPSAYRHRASRRPRADRPGRRSGGCSPSGRSGSGCCRFARPAGCVRARWQPPTLSTSASAPSPAAAAPIAARRLHPWPARRRARPARRGRGFPRCGAQPRAASTL